MSQTQREQIESMYLDCAPRDLKVIGLGENQSGATALKSKYHKEIKHGVVVGVYDILSGPIYRFLKEQKESA